MENSKLSDYVTVLKVPLSEKDEDSKTYDQLICDYLKLVFRRKENAGPNTGLRDPGSTDREIETAHAVSRADRPQEEQVTLALDAEKLHAFCMELFYTAPTPTCGPQTLLIGTPVKANKENHIIVGKEILLIAADLKGNGQMMTAKGPGGHVDLYDQSNEKNHWPVHALWTDLLTVVKDKQGDTVYDLLTFTVDASFIDDEHLQELHGQKLKVWLEPADKTAPASEVNDQNQTASTAPRQRPWKVEATTQVRAKSPDMIVHECRVLTILFEDGVIPLPMDMPPPNGTPDPGALPPAAPNLAAAPGVSPGPAVPGAPPATAPTPVVAGSSPKTGASDKDKDADKKPMQMWARDIATYVTRMGQKNQLREMVAEGNVKVHQDGKEIKDKDGKFVLTKDGKVATERGIDINGEILTLYRYPTGDKLKVFAADPDHPAHLWLNDLELLGPMVEIDQPKNICYIRGAGAMSLPSDKTFDGGQPTKPGTRLKVTGPRTCSSTATTPTSTKGWSPNRTWPPCAATPSRSKWTSTSRSRKATRAVREPRWRRWWPTTKCTWWTLPRMRRLMK